MEHPGPRAVDEPLTNRQRGRHGIRTRAALFAGLFLMVAPSAQAAVPDPERDSSSEVQT
jgi:hypothetical protein